MFIFQYHEGTLFNIPSGKWTHFTMSYTKRLSVLVHKDCAENKYLHFWESSNTVYTEEKYLKKLRGKYCLNSMLLDRCVRKLNCLDVQFPIIFPSQLLTHRTGRHPFPQTIIIGWWICTLSQEIGGFPGHLLKKKYCSNAADPISTSSVRRADIKGNSQIPIINILETSPGILALL